MGCLGVATPSTGCCVGRMGVLVPAFPGDMGLRTQHGDLGPFEMTLGVNERRDTSTSSSAVLFQGRPINSEPSFINKGDIN